MAYFEERPVVFSDLVRLIDVMDLRHALTIKCDWNHAAILQFYATYFFDEVGSLAWRTHQTTITITYEQWCEALGMPVLSDALFRIHGLNDEFEPMAIDKCMRCLMPMSEMPKDVTIIPNNSALFLPLYRQFHQCLLRTLVPKHGDKSMVRSFGIDFLVHVKATQDAFEDGLPTPRPIDVADFIWNEICGFSLQKN